MSSCGPKSITTDPEELSTTSKSWIPFNGNENITFYQDSNTVVFQGQGKESYFENVRYMSDQSGFFVYQEDYYADLEREDLIFESSSTDYFFIYHLEKDKGETGDWDILKVKVADGNYYANEIKLVIYETDSYDKGEIYKFKATVTLSGNVYTDVYYWTQESRPYELYYTQARGIVGYKVSTNEMWTIDPPAK